MSLDLPPNQGSDREEAILDCMRQGKFLVTYQTITSDVNGHHGEFLVFSDALKIDGVRVNVCAQTEQAIADILGCMLLTPKLADLIWLQKDATIKPFPRPITSSTQAMIDHSADIDKAIASLSAAPNLPCTVGKHWTVSNGLLAHPGRAENYGWHFDGALPGIPAEAAVTPGLKLIQGRGWAHDMHHVDYSQTCVLVSRQCQVDGQGRDLTDVLKDPDLAPLANHDGVLKVLRQPGT